MMAPVSKKNWPGRHPMHTPRNGQSMRESWLLLINCQQRRSEMSGGATYNATATPRCTLAISPSCEWGTVTVSYNSGTWSASVSGADNGSYILDSVSGTIPPRGNTGLVKYVTFRYQCSGSRKAVAGACRLDRATNKADLFKNTVWMPNQWMCDWNNVEADSPSQAFYATALCCDAPSL